MDISKKKALVFGGTSGIGLATCNLLMEKGAEVIALSREPDKAKGKNHNKITLEKCDVREVEELDQVFKKYAPYDILVSAATGGTRAAGNFLEMDMPGFRSSFDKLWGYANVIRHGTEYLTQNGSIVLVSGAPARKTKPGMVTLSVVGGAVENLVRAAALEMSPKRINVVSPGIIDTPLFPQEGDEREQFIKNVTSNHSIKRAGTPEEVAAAIIFLIENDFVNGTTVDVDGGWLLS